MLLAGMLVEQLYDALRRRDTDAAVGLLHPACVGLTCPGLPHVGGRVAYGPQEWLSRIWVETYRHFDVVAVPEEHLQVGTGTVVTLGTYRGVARGTGRVFEAWFAHVWTVLDGRVSGLRQVTDTARWAAALDQSATSVGDPERHKGDAADSGPAYSQGRE
ncbi:MULTISPECIES: nuclear transport factor 2 family protein [unclassified Micromonospora]|uniref:nuclear transport factor 2 family protein n=1 Tax=unclassified Micromonospora TaxID=2617518 RepID=UPI0033BD1012